MTVQHFIDWITARDYVKAKAEGERRVVARFSRGNVLVQSGRYMTEADAAVVISRGDRAMQELERAASK